MNLIQRLTDLSLCNTHKAFESVIFELSMIVNMTANSMSLSSKQGPSTLHSLGFEAILSSNLLIMFRRSFCRSETKTERVLKP